MSLIDALEPDATPEFTQPKSLRLALVIPTMEAGGAERVAATLCNQWSKCGHDIHLITFENELAESAYFLSASITLHKLDLLRSSRSPVDFVIRNLRRIFVLRRSLRAIAADVVISFMPEPNVITLIASQRQNWPVIISERVHPAFMPLSRIPAIMRRIMYPRAAAIVAQARIIADYIDRTFNVTTTVIPNPIDLTLFTTRSTTRFKPDRRRVVSVGRLAQQKGFDVLIDAFSLVSQDFIDWDLVIFGEGYLRDELEEKLIELNLKDRVRLAGTVRDIAQEFLHTDIYAQSSRFEGTPNAVIEALACGCPVIATDCPGGIRDIIGDNEYGQLVPVDKAIAFAAALRRLMGDETIRHTMSERAPAAVAGLSVSIVAAQWINLARRLISERRLS